MLGVVIQIDGWDPVAGVAVTLRAGSHDDPAVCHLNGQTWWPALGKLPVLRYDLFDGAFGGQIVAPEAQATLRTEPWPSFGRYALADARVRLWTGDVGAEWAGWVQRFDGRMTAQPKIVDGAADLPFAVDDRWLDQPLLATYAGTTGVEGPAALKGTAKPLALGAPRYVAGVLIDPTNSVFQISAYGAIQGVEAALERLARFGASAGDHASFAALVAATVPPGRWATCLASGLVRFGAPPNGQISFLAQGDTAGPNGWARRPGEIVRRIAQVAGALAKVDGVSLDALNLSRPYDLSIYLDQQTTARELVQRIAASVNAVAVVTWLGQLKLLPVAIGMPTLTLAADGSALPPVSSVTQIEVAAPFKRIAVEAERTWTVHPLGDVATAAQLVDLGDYAAGTTYREGNIVQDQGSTWLYTAITPSAGNAPPTLPTESNSWWKVLARAGADGVSAYAILLTNENHIVPADAGGNVITYNGATTNVVIYSAGADVTGSFALSIVSNPQALTVAPITGNTVTVTGGLDAGEPNAVLTIRATGSGAFAGVVLDKVFSLTKSRAGADGAPAPLISVSASSQAVRYDAADQIVTGDITITTVRQHSAEAPRFTIVSADGATHGTAGYTAQQLKDAYGSITFDTTSPDTLILKQAWVNTVIQSYGGAFRVTAAVTGASDVTSATKVKDGENGEPGEPGEPGSPGEPGAPAYGFQVSVASFTVATDATGTAKPGALPIPFAVKVTKGELDVTADASISFSGTTGVATGHPSASSNTLTAIGPTDGYLIVNVSIEGTTFPPHQLPITQARDQPAPSTLSSARQGFGGTINGTSFTEGNAGDRNAVISVAGGATVPFYAFLPAYFADTSGGIVRTATVQGKIQYRLVGSADWLDATVPVNGTTATFTPGEGPEPGTITVTGSVGPLTDGNYEWRFIGRQISPSNSTATTYSGAVLSIGS